MTTGMRDAGGFPGGCTAVTGQHLCADWMRRGAAAAASGRW